MYAGLITRKPAPPNRQSKAQDGIEEHFTEPAVMLAFAMHLLDRGAECLEVSIHPDGEHGKRFDIQRWLAENRFEFKERRGSTSYGGVYQRGEQRIVVALTPGKGDVVAQIGDYKVAAECKGGVINSKHAGQKSRLRQGLCEVIGLLMTREPEGERHIAVVPATDETKKLSNRLAARCRNAGIEIALVESNGTVIYVES